MTRHLEGLNPEQRQAVLATQGPLLVLAGAGTGKTRVITARIAQLLEESVAPGHILAVTFTNKAAREMKERVVALVGKKQGRSVRVGTFHRFCLDLLREYPGQVGLPARFSICDASDQIAIVRKALRELSVPEASLNPRMAQSRISLLKNRMVGVEEFERGVVDDDDDLLGRLYRRYEKALRQTGSVDFDDILLLAERLLRENEEVRRAVRDQNRFVLVDEYQDTNGPQYAVVKHIAGEHRNLCVVGDDDQSIYGWRGADVTRILRFAEDFHGALVVRLETNYRSTKPILDAANRVIANNTQRHDKKLRSSVGSGHPLRFFGCEDEHDEADTIVREIQMLVAKDLARLGDVAVLFRTGTQPRVFETQLRARGVPYVLVGGPSFFDRKEVRDVLAYLRLIHNPTDEAAFLRVVNCPARGVGATSLERAMAAATAQGITVMEAFEGGVEGVTPRATEAVREFLAVIASLRQRVAGNDLVRFISMVLEGVSYRTELERRYPDELTRRERWAAVDEILNAADGYLRRNRKPELGAFLQELALTADDDRSSEDAHQRDKITLMTLHAAKGLEFPRVYLVGLEEGILPHARSVDEGGLEEERRLMYVGITRARLHLTLSLAKTRARAGTRSETYPSRFFYELQGEAPPDDWIATEQPRPKAKKKGSKKRGKKTRQAHR